MVFVTANAGPELWISRSANSVLFVVSSSWLLEILNSSTTKNLNRCSSFSVISSRPVNKSISLYSCSISQAQDQPETKPQPQDRRSPSKSTFKINEVSEWSRENIQDGPRAARENWVKYEKQIPMQGHWCRERTGHLHRAHAATGILEVLFCVPIPSQAHLLRRGTCDTVYVLWAYNLKLWHTYTRNTIYQLVH